AAMLGAPLPPGVVHQDMTHGFGRRSEEVGTAVPVRFRAAAHEAKISLVDQGGGLERLPRALAGEFLGGQLAQLDRRSAARPGWRRWHWRWRRHSGVG